MERTEELVSLAKQGDRQAFGALYAQCYTDLYRYAPYMLKDPEDAKDAVSEAVFDAFRSIHTLKDASAFRAWMFKILSRRIFRMLRQVKYTELSESMSAPICETKGCCRCVQQPFCKSIVKLKESVKI